MSLKEKLQVKTEAIRADAEAQKELQRNKELEPIRANINKLEKEKYHLEMIKNSLDFNSQEVKDGLGMKNYSKKIENEKKETRGELEETISEHQAALEKDGISNVDDLVDHQEYGEEKEVLAYKQALKQEEGLQLSDEELKKRLAELNINISEENFSYESVSHEISLRLADLEKELLADKLKTPEGKEEIINNLAEDFSKNIKILEFEATVDKSNQKNNQDFNHNQEDAFYRFGLKDQPDTYRRESITFIFYGDKMILNNYYSLTLPDNFSSQVDKVGLEVAQTALQRSYQQKLDAAFNNPNVLLGRAKRIKEAVDSFNPERRGLAIEALNNFKTKKQELLRLLQIKSTELKNQGIDFSPTSARAFGGQYEDLFKFNRYCDSEEMITKLETKHYPNNHLMPLYDYDKLKVITERRIKELDEAIEIINNIKDENDVKNFDSNKSDSYIGRFHQHLINNHIEAQAEFKLPVNVQYREIEELSNQFNSQEQAAQHLKNEVARLEQDKDKIAAKLSEAVEYKVAEKELYRNHKDVANLDKLESIIKDIERERKNAKLALKVIINLEFKLAKIEDVEGIVVKGTKVEIQSKVKESEQLNEDREKKEKELQKKEKELKIKGNKEPFFGKSKWRDQVSSLKAEIEKIKTEIQDLSDKYNQAIKDRFYYLDMDDLEYSKSKELIENYSNAGKAEEAFGTLKEQLTELSKEEIPTDLQEYHDKLKSLKDSLTSKA